MESKKTVRIEGTAGSAAPPGSEPRYGGRFSTIRRLGEGSMGVVYEAIDRQSGARVALKTLPGATPGAIYHLKNEFRALTDVVHPNLVTLHELYADDSAWFFTMELVEGIPFDEYLRVGALLPEVELRGEPTQLLHPGAVSAAESTEADELDRAFDSSADNLEAQRVDREHASDVIIDEPRLLRALYQLAAGVHALHEAGKLHRDLKPSNVLVTAAGEVKVLDFGLASDDSPDPIGQTVVGRLAGTPAYMAPELSGGERPTPASDWYSVGVILYEVLSGRVPFDGALQELFRRKQHETPEPVSAYCSVSPELAALCMALLARKPEDRPSGPEILALLAPYAGPSGEAFRSARPLASAPPTSGFRQVAPFVGREHELSVLAETLRATEHGEAWVVHVTGPSGIGKSTLAQCFAERTAEESGTVVLRGRCFERESVPYKGIDGIIDALSRHLRRLPARDVARVLPRNVQVLCRVFPVLARVDAIVNAPRRGLDLPLDPAEQRRLAWGALRDLLGRVADAQPLLLCIDDFQWADRDSARLLSSLLAPPDAPPLLLLLAYRGEDRRERSGLGMLLGELGKNGARERTLELSGLGHAQVVELVASLVPSDYEVDVEACVRETEGNPFFVHELLRQVQRRAVWGEHVAAPLDLDAAIRARVDALPDDARRLLQVAALAARPTRLDVLGLAARTPDPRAALRKLQASSLLRTSTQDANLVETYHNRLRAAVVHALSSEEQRALHARLAEALLERDGDPETLAEHFLAAGDSQRAYLHALRAAPRAEQALSFDRAARFYRMAIELCERVEPEQAQGLYLRYAEALAHAGRCLDAAGAYELAAEHEAGDAAGTRLRTLAAMQLLLAGRAEQGMQRLERALSAYGVQGFRGSADEREHIVRTLGEYVALATRLEPSIVWRSQAELGVDELARLDVIHAAALGLAWLDMGTRYFALVLEDAKASLEAREPARVVASGALLSSILESLGGAMPPPAAQLVEQAKTLVSEPSAAAWADYGVGASAYFHSRFQQASVVLGRAEATFRDRCRGVARELVIVRIPLAISLRWSGRLREVIAACERWGAAAREQGDLFTELWMQLLDIGAQCEDRSLLARQRVEDALARLEAFVAQGVSAGAAAVVRLIGQVRRAEVDWYDGAFTSAYEHVRALLRERGGDTAALVQDDSSEAARLPLHSMQLVWHRSRAFCGELAARGALDAELQTELDELLVQHGAFSIPMMSTVGLLHAAVARAAGDKLAAAQHLLEEARYVETVYENAERAAGYRLHAGLLMGGSVGAALCEEAETTLRAHGVQNPTRWARVLAPGF